VHQALDAVQAALQTHRQHIVPDTPRTVGAVAKDEALAHLRTQHFVVPLALARRAHQPGNDIA